jgi:GxxExxY protein
MEGTGTEDTERTGSHRETKERRENGDLFFHSRRARPHCSICNGGGPTINIPERFRSASILLLRPTMHVDPSEFNEVTGRILGAAIEVHRTLGAGLLESIYMTCLEFELTARHLRYVAQRVVPIVYKGMEVQACYRVDLIVEDLVVVEVKSTAALLPVHQSQLLTYMGLTNCPAGLLINFNVPRLMDGVKRMLNPRASASPKPVLEP